MLVDQPRCLVSPANLARLCKKTEGKDPLNVRHLPMQETLQGASSSGMLMQRDNSKPLEVVGLQLTRPMLSEALQKKPKKTRAGRNGTRGLMQLRHETSPQQTMDPKRLQPKGCKLIQINVHHGRVAMALLC
jgi:hypothetical protein